jgi:hypothetical protein
MLIRVLLAASALGSASIAMAAPITMEGNYLKVGTSDRGTLGSNGSTSPGILHDPTGTKNFGVNDYLTPGTPHEGFGVAYGSVTSGLWSQATNASSSTNFGSTSPTLLVGAAAMGFANAVSWSGTDGRVNITHSYFFNNNDERIKVVTTITALRDLDNIAFARSIDPDPDVNTFGSFATNNQRGNSLFGINDFIGAAGPRTGLTIGLLNLSGTDFVSGTSINSSCCNNVNPFNVLSNSAGGLGLTSTGDHSLNMAWRIGNMTGGQSVALTYAYVFGDNIETVGGGVPEPTSWAMLIAGFGLVGGAARRRRSNVQAA